MPSRHPLPTGVAPPNLQKLTGKQRREIAQWIRGWELAHVDEAAFAEEVANAVWLYPSWKQLADSTSAGAIRRNLDTAIADGQRFLVALNALDGNGLSYISELAGGRSVREDAAEILLSLREARQRVEAFPKRGPRPRPERIQFASLLLRALRLHTSANPTSTTGGIFEELLCLGFRLAGEKHEDLHNLAAKTLAANLQIEEDGGVMIVPSPE